MAVRCGCPNEGDETVFGERHDCTVTDRLTLNPIPTEPEELG